MKHVQANVVCVVTSGYLVAKYTEEITLGNSARWHRKLTLGTSAREATDVMSSLEVERTHHIIQRDWSCIINMGSKHC